MCVCIYGCGVLVCSIPQVFKHIKKTKHAILLATTDEKRVQQQHGRGRDEGEDEGGELEGKGRRGKRKGKRNQ